MWVLFYEKQARPVLIFGKEESYLSSLNDKK
jgi:hypothetical protein